MAHILHEIIRFFAALFGPGSAAIETDDLGDLYGPDNLFEKDESTLELVDENGETCYFRLLDLFEYEGDDYLLLLPKYEEEPEPLFLLKHPQKKLYEDAYSSVDDEKTQRILLSVFRDRASRRSEKPVRSRPTV